MADLQSKMGEGLSKLQGGIEQGKNKQKTTQEVSKLKKQIQDTSAKKAELLINLGQAAYQLIREGKITDHQLIDLAQPMIGFDQVIYQANKTTAELTEENNKQYVCDCGAPINPADKFCGNCGKKVTIEEPEQIALIQCPSCEEEMPEDTKYCVSCGTKLAG